MICELGLKNRLLLWKFKVVERLRDKCSTRERNGTAISIAFVAVSAHSVQQQSGDGSAANALREERKKTVRFGARWDNIDNNTIKTTESFVRI